MRKTSWAIVLIAPLAPLALKIPHGPDGKGDRRRRLEYAQGKPKSSPQVRVDNRFFRELILVAGRVYC